MTLQFYVHDIVVTDTTEERYISHDLNTVLYNQLIFFNHLMQKILMHVNWIFKKHKKITQNS